MVHCTSILVHYFIDMLKIPEKGIFGVQANGHHKFGMDIMTFRLAKNPERGWVGVVACNFLFLPHIGNIFFLYMNGIFLYFVVCMMRTFEPGQF